MAVMLGGWEGNRSPQAWQKGSNGSLPPTVCRVYGFSHQRADKDRDQFRNRTLVSGIYDYI